MNILVVVAHPDDEILGMGGTMLKLTEENHKVRIVYLATGIASRRSSNYKNNDEYSLTNKDLLKNQILELQDDAKRACSILNVKDVNFYDFPDNELDSIPLLKIIKIIEKHLNEFKPEKVFTTHYNDLNIDHRIVYNATLTACRPIENSVKEIITFEVPSSTEWNYPAKFNPNYFISIEKYLSKKIRAFKEYKNEKRDFPHPRSERVLEILAMKWGSVSGTNAAEAFEIIRKIER